MAMLINQRCKRLQFGAAGVHRESGRILLVSLLGFPQCMSRLAVAGRAVVSSGHEARAPAHVQRLPAAALVRHVPKVRLEPAPVNLLVRRRDVLPHCGSEREARGWVTHAQVQCADPRGGRAPRRARQGTLLDGRCQQRRGGVRACEDEPGAVRELVHGLDQALPERLSPDERLRGRRARGSGLG